MARTTVYCTGGVEKIILKLGLERNGRVFHAVKMTDSTTLPAFA